MSCGGSLVHCCQHLLCSALCFCMTACALLVHCACVCIYLCCVLISCFRRNTPSARVILCRQQRGC